MKLDSLLSVLEQEKLNTVASDKVMLGAIKKVVLSSVYFDGTIKKSAEPESLKNFALALASQPGVSNEQLGANLKASLAGVQLLETGFKELEKWEIVKIKPNETKNQSR